MEVRRLARALLGLLCVLGSCSESAEPTELVVVVDSDLSVPGALDEIRVRAIGPDGEAQVATAVLGEGMPALPRTLVLNHVGGALGPFSVRVEGGSDGQSVVSREAEVSFLRGKSLVLPLHLVSACRGEQCPDGESCGEDGCQDVSVDPDLLSEWSGEKPTLDAGPRPDGGALDASTEGGAGKPDAGMCMPQAEQCNGTDDDCDGRIDDGFNLSIDVDNCGSCGVRCNVRRGDICCRGSCARAPCL